MIKYLLPVFVVILCVPTLAFADSSAPTPNEQYVSFLKQEIATLQAELVQLQATSTPTTTPSETKGSIVVPAKSWCSTIEWAQHCTYFED